MKNAKATLTFTLILCAGLAANAKNSGQKTIADFAEVFMGVGNYRALESKLKQAPPDVSTLIVNNYDAFERQAYHQISKDGSTAVTVAPIVKPSKEVDFSKYTATIVHSNNGEGFTYSLPLNSGGGKPLFGEVPHQDIIPQISAPDGKFGFALSREANEAGLRHKDYVASIPSQITIQNGKVLHGIENRYGVIKADGDDLRFTLQTKLDIFPFEGEGKIIKGADGKPQYVPPQSIMSVEAAVFRDKPGAPITKLEGKFKGRGEKEAIKFEFEVPKPSDRGTRQILDVKFVDDPDLNKQTMEIVTTDGYRLTYAMDVKDKKVSFRQIKSVDDSENILASYKVQVKPLKGRTTVDSTTGTGPKEIDIDAGR